MNYAAISERVTARQAAERYNLEIGRNGRAKCPWHDDHRPDLSFHGAKCHCFACGEGGDAVDLTAQLFNLSLIDAAWKLNVDFNLGLNMDASTIQAGPSQAELRRQEHVHENQLWGTLCEVVREADKRLLQLDSAGDAAWDNPAFVNALEARSRAEIALENIWGKGVNK